MVVSVGKNYEPRGGLEHGFYISIYWQFHHPNGIICFRGVGIPPTRICENQLHQLYPN
jgi:hypothetical protein